MLKYNIPDATSKDVVADWVEFYVTYLKNSISKTQLSSYVQASIGSDPDDAFIDSVWNILRERVVLYGRTPPIQVESRVINNLVNWQECPEYLACLIYALEGNPNTPSASASEAGKYFERISNEAVKNYLNGKSIIYGFPTDQGVEEIANDLLKEKFSHLPPSYRKDRNLDIVAWKDWGDDRSSQIILLVQCAAGGNWKTKLKELNLKAWEKYINFSAAPMKGFSVPVIISDREDLNEISTDAGVFIDRPRLYRQTYGITFSDAALRSTLETWCNSRIAEINS